VEKPPKPANEASGFIKEFKFIGQVFDCQIRHTMCAVFQQVQLVFPTIVTGNMEEHVNRAAEFLPERWLKSPSDSLYRIHPFASLPYGHGARMCLGRRFADMEIQILLAKASRCIITLYIPCAPQLIFFLGATAPSGPGPPHSRGFHITLNGALQSAGLLWTSDQPVAETST